MQKALGDQVNARLYPDWIASQTEAVRTTCTNPKVVTSVAEGDTALVGFVCVVLRPIEKTGEIDLIAVDPAAQRQRIGTALVERAITQIKGADCSLVEVATGGDPGHAPARALYEQAGFTPLPLVRYYRLV